MGHCVVGLSGSGARPILGPRLTGEQGGPMLSTERARRARVPRRRTLDLTDRTPNLLNTSQTWSTHGDGAPARPGAGRATTVLPAIRTELLRPYRARTLWLICQGRRTDVL